MCLQQLVDEEGAGILVAPFSVHYKEHRVRRQAACRTRQALKIEMDNDRKLANDNQKFYESYMTQDIRQRKKMALIPFSMDVWNSIVARGAFELFDKEELEDLVDLYQLIGETNSVMGAQQ